MTKKEKVIALLEDLNGSYESGYVFVIGNELLPVSEIIRQLRITPPYETQPERRPTTRP